MYGGVSFWESEPDHERNIYPRGFKETLTLCDNYTNINSEHFEKETKTTLDVGYLKSEYLEKDSKNYILPYVSFRRETILVLYHTSHQSLNVSLQISSTSCKGVFYRHYLMQHNEPCVIHQLGLAYLPMVNHGSELYMFYANVIKVLGCTRVFLFFPFGKKSKGICQTNMDLTYLIQERNYFTLPLKGNYTNSIAFDHKISGLHHFGCKDSPQSIFLRGQKFFQFSMNESSYGSSVHRLSVNVSLVDPVIRSHRNGPSARFTLVFRPSSKSFVFVILRQQKCEATNKWNYQQVFLSSMKNLRFVSGNLCHNLYKVIC